MGARAPRNGTTARPIGPVGGTVRHGQTITVGDDVGHVPGSGDSRGQYFEDRFLTTSTSGSSIL
eukprot:6156932-Pyramimonas_sp.AAC.1